MEKPYLPLARKYRPHTFDDLIGQPHVTETLARAIESKRVGQAYLFTGQRGVGKTSAARILAKALTCAKGPTAKPCQKCASCLAINQGNSLDVLEIDGASNRGIDEVRSLRETIKFAPTHGAYRIYIIDEVHMLTTEAFNALLKTLEEPPAHVKFIFATTAPQKLPATILSRCQRFDFRRVETKTMVAALQKIAKAEKIEADNAALYTIARASDGSLRDAEVTLEQAASFCQGRITEQGASQLLGAVEQDVLTAWAQAMLDRDAGAALRILTQQLEAGKDIIQILLGLLMHMRNLLILRTTEKAPTRPQLLERLLDLPKERLEQLDKQAKACSPEEFLMIVQALTGAYELARRSPFAQAVVEFVLIKLATRESWASLEQLMQRLETAPTDGGRSHPESEARGKLEIQGTAPGPAASRAPSVAATTPELGALRRQWPSVVERVGQQKMSLSAYLMQTQPLAMAGNELEVGILGFALHQEVLEATDAVRLVEAAVQQITGQTLNVRYTIIAETDVPDPAGDPERGARGKPEGVPPLVQDIVSLFNATVVKPPSS
jgi:DNA polymerase-3 subunit gamma/tau